MSSYNPYSDIIEEYQIGDNKYYDMLILNKAFIFPYCIKKGIVI